MKNSFTALCLLVCFAVQAKIYYVSPSGNDNAINNSISTPYDSSSVIVNYPFPYTVFYTDTKPKTFYFKGDYYKDIKGKVYKDSLTLQSCTGAILFKIPSN